MPKTIHQVDPNADTVIVLRNPITNFAPWDQPALAQKIVKEEYPKTNESSAENTTRGSMHSTHEQQSTNSLFGNGVETNSTPQEDPKDAIEEDCGEPPHENDDEDVVFYRVSSRHLILASPKFKAMLSGEKWQEGIRNEADNLFYIYTAEWDPSAFLVVMNIMHLRNRLVPRQVTLEMLTKIAVIVDYYDCLEAVETFSPTWVGNVGGLFFHTTKTPEKYSRDLILWLCSTWVFRSWGPFKKATTVAIRSSDEPIRTLSLPIPHSVIDAIDNERSRAIEGLLKEVYKLLSDLHSPNYRCADVVGRSYECGAILLGSLFKGLSFLNISSARPVAPFYLMTVDSTYREILFIKNPQWLKTITVREEQTIRGPYGAESVKIVETDKTEPHVCSLFSKLGAARSLDPATIEGLDLLKYLSKQ